MCLFTSNAVFFLPQFSTLITLPPSRWTMARMRSTILSTRSSARSGRTRKIVSYSRNVVPGGCVAPPVVCVSVCCITSPHGSCPRARRERGLVRFASFSALLLRCLPRSPVVPVRRHQRSFEERRHRRIRRDRDELLQRLLLFRRELRQNPVRPFPLLRRPAHSEPHPHRVARSEVLPDAAQAVVPRVATALLHLDSSELQVDLVVHHHDLIRRHLPDPRRLPHRLSAQVHVPLREQDRGVLRLADHRVPAGFPERRAQLSGRLLGDAKADVVAGALVLRGRVPQADEEAHRLLLGALVGRGSLRGGGLRGGGRGSRCGARSGGRACGGSPRSARSRG